MKNVRKDLLSISVVSANAGGMLVFGGPSDSTKWANKDCHDDDCYMLRWICVF